jgi:Family of unknown function (DUF6152)
MFAATAWSHHNMSAIYDFNDKVMMSGTLSKIDWRNPLTVSGSFLQCR